MGQRLISTRKHPITGKEVSPLWFDQYGVAFYPLIGAAPDGDDDGEEEEGSDDDAGGDTGSEGQGSDDGKKVTAEDLARLEARMKAADKRASAAEMKVKEFEDKDKDEVTKSAERISALETENSELKQGRKDDALQIAFLSSNDIDWHDKSVALKHADLSEVMDEDGNVDKAALKKALEALSKSMPFLVKTSDGKEGDEPKGPSGIPAGSGTKKKGVGLDEEALRKKYPALNH